MARSTCASPRRDVWTLNPGFNFGRSGGTNSTGVQLEDINFLGSGADVSAVALHHVDRTSSHLSVGDQHAFGSWVSRRPAPTRHLSDGYQREFTVQQPFYALDTRWAAGVYGIHDLQTDSLWDHGQIIDQFQDLHQGAQIYGGWSEGLQNGWVRRWSTGVTYDEHDFAPVSTWTGPTQIPEDRRFAVSVGRSSIWCRTITSSCGITTRSRAPRTSTSAPRRACAPAGRTAVWGSSQNALIFQSNASTRLSRRRLDAAARSGTSRDG